MNPPATNAIVYRADALTAGLTDRDLARLERLAPGCYTRVDTRRLHPAQRHRLMAIAVATKSGPDVVLSHQSAAAVLGLAMLGPDLRRVHLTSARVNGNVRGVRHLHAGPLADDEITAVDGVAVTGLERTAVDLACTSRFPAALTIMDSALRAGGSRERIAQMCAARRCRGIRIARRALELADGESANPGESWSRAQMIGAKLLIPVLQRELWVEGKQYFLDFDFDCLVNGEFDGEGKYLDHRRPGEDIAAAVIREKNRENAIRSTGRDVVRWDWDDLRGGRMLPRLTNALARARLL
jgi:predicted transcriptional regulator of viral defense system